MFFPELESGDLFEINCLKPGSNLVDRIAAYCVTAGRKKLLCVKIVAENGPRFGKLWFIRFTLPLFIFCKKRWYLNKRPCFVQQRALHHTNHSKIRRDTGTYYKDYLEQLAISVEAFQKRNANFVEANSYTNPTVDTKQQIK